MPKPRKRFAKIFVEITNICNLNCDFCRGTSRPLGFLDVEKFKEVAKKIVPFTNYVYLHLMGEPLLHPRLDEILNIANENGLKVGITTNGTLIKKVLPTLEKNADKIYKISVSLHSFEANGGVNVEEYLKSCVDSVRALGKLGVISVLRLWNLEGLSESTIKNKENGHILNLLHNEFNGEWSKSRGGTKIGDSVYLEFGERFDWPDYNATDYGEYGFCHALNDHVGILLDGTVVPCCLDGDGQIPLGNVYCDDLLEILNGKTAKTMLDGFAKNKLVHPLCRHCGFARKFI